MIGNSVASYVRPLDGGGQPYGRVLETALADADLGAIHVDIWAENSTTIGEVAESIEDRLVAYRPDVVVFNLGIVECTPRAVPQRLRRRFVRGRTPMQRMWLAGEKLVRRPLVRILGGASATTVQAFEAALVRLAEVARHETAARVFCLGIPATTNRVTEEVAGISRQIAQFDQAVRRACDRTGTEYLDIGSIVAAEGAEELLPDGIHFSAKGHVRVGQELARRIRQESLPVPVPSRASPEGLPPPRLVARFAITTAGLVLAGVALIWIPACRIWRALTGSR